MKDASLTPLTSHYVQCMCCGCKMSPWPTPLCSYTFLLLWNHQLCVVNIKFHSSARGVMSCEMLYYKLVNAILVEIIAKPQEYRVRVYHLIRVGQNKLGTHCETIQPIQKITHSVLISKLSIWHRTIIVDVCYLLVARQ